MLESVRVEKANKFRKVLVTIVDCALFLGRRGLPFRGENDNCSQLKSGEYSVDRGIGNFEALLKFGLRRGDQVLLDHCSNLSKNATYFSSEVQNEIIDCCGEQITEKIIKKVKEARFFSILDGEAMDASKKEQLSLVLRYVHNNVIFEDFIYFLHLKDGLKGEHLANTIVSCIERLGLNIQNLRGQGYDGAGSVAGIRNGCAARITQINRKALYTHCMSHRLNFVISKACSVKSG